MRTDQEPHPPDRQSSLLALVISMMVLTTVSVALRLWSRFLVSMDYSQRFWWDDFFAIAAFPVQMSVLGLSIYWIKVGGLGLDLALISMDQLMLTLKLVYIESIIYCSAIMLPRFSVVFFYARVFRAHPTFIKYLWGLGVYMIIFFVQQSFFNIAQCFPIRKAWDPLIPHGWCFDYYKDWLAQSIGYLVLDLIILVSPLPILFRLKASWSTKLQIIGLFICAYSVIAIAIGRVVSIAKTANDFKDNPTYAPISYLSWCCTEASVTLFGICLPNIFQLIKRAARHGGRSLFTRRGFSHRSDGSGRAAAEAEWRAGKEREGKKKAPEPDVITTWNTTLQGMSPVLEAYEGGDDDGVSHHGLDDEEAATGSRKASRASNRKASKASDRKASRASQRRFSERRWSRIFDRKGSRASQEERRASEQSRRESEAARDVDKTLVVNDEETAREEKD